MNFIPFFRVFQISKRFYSSQSSILLLQRLPFFSVSSKSFPRTSQNSTRLKILFSCRLSFLQRNRSSFSTDYHQTNKVEDTEEQNQHPNRRTVYIDSLNFLTDEEKLRSHFSSFGEVEHVRIVRRTSTRIPKNYGFVRFKSIKSVENALQGKNFVDSRWLDVCKHDQEAENESKIYVKNIPDCDKMDVRDYFSQYGVVERVSIPMDGNQRRNYGFIKFSSEAAAVKVLQQVSHSIQGQAIQVSTCIARRRNSVPGKVLVDFLPDNVLLEDVKKYFEHFGLLNSIDMVFQRNRIVKKNFAFLAFQDGEVAKQLSDDDRKHYINEQEVIVQPMHSSAMLRALSREKKVFVENIPLGKTKEEILAHFNQFGEALHIHLIDNWAEQQLSQCGIIRFKSKRDVDRVISYTEILMDENPLSVRQLGYTAKTSSEYTPLYLEFRKKHRLVSKDSKESIGSTDEDGKSGTLNQYPVLK